ncbi:MAG: hypothetical protein M1818_007680 [Claussenomyces sp. TS43310]|nr:MAG: hypothetical protein M1818_007680 [Claussenomyces sp. TS43310]
MQQVTGKEKLSASMTIACAGLAGGAAGMIGNPTEIVLVRMCADGVKEPSQRYSYGNAFKGIVRIGRDEGLATFTRGLAPNLIRSILMNVAQIVVYSKAKARLLSNKFYSMDDGVPVHIIASLTAGTVATTVCAPADVLKSRIQSAATVSGKKPGMLQILVRSLKEEGPRVLMKGWTPAWLRLTPHTILTFLFMEQLQRLVGSKTL